MAVLRTLLGEALRTTRLRQERIRPLIPSVLIRGAATNPAGTLSTGYFGGGVNDKLSNFNARHRATKQGTYRRTFGFQIPHWGRCQMGKGPAPVSLVP